MQDVTIVAGTFEGLAPSKWPRLDFNWDTSASAYLHTVNQPTGLIPSGHVPHKYVLALGWSTLDQVDQLLSPHSRQDHVSDFWERGQPHKFARLLEHLHRGLPISPPMLKIVESGHLFLAGGHHRYAIARVVGVKELPFFVETTIRERIAATLPVRWSDA